MRHQLAGAAGRESDAIPDLTPSKALQAERGDAPGSALHAVTYADERLLGLAIDTSKRLAHDAIPLTERPRMIQCGPGSGSSEERMQRGATLRADEGGRAVPWRRATTAPTGRP